MRSAGSAIKYNKSIKYSNALSFCWRVLHGKLIFFELVGKDDSYKPCCIVFKKHVLNSIQKISCSESKAAISRPKASHFAIQEIYAISSFLYDSVTGFTTCKQRTIKREDDLIVYFDWF